MIEPYIAATLKRSWGLKVVNDTRSISLVLICGADTSLAIRAALLLQSRPSLA
jgi:hypothetical protein